jgi:UDP-2-acetamido-2-deoxy-ribo-hexuluronate aminotransferase
VQAAVLLKRLPRVAPLVERRRANAALYAQLLTSKVVKPADHPGDRDAYYTYTIRTPQRDALKAFIEARGVETKIQHPLLMPQQPAYAPGARGSWPNALKLVPEVLCLPIHEKLEASDVEYVSACVNEFFASH